MSIKARVKHRMQSGIWSVAYAPLRGAYGLNRSIKRRLSRNRLLQPGWVVPFDSKYKHNFCGYYGNSPFCELNESLILVHSTNASMLRNPSPSEEVVVRVVDWRSGREVAEVGRTTAWNWQQGSRAMWCAPMQWIYNEYDVDRGMYLSVTGSVDGYEKKRLSFPVQEVGSDGALYSINYAALSRFRPDYGYFNRRVTKGDLEDSALIEFDLNDDRSKNIISIQELRMDASRRSGAGISSYKINHVASSPSGKRIVFMFRYRDSQDNRITDVYCFDKETSLCEVVLPGCGVSHYCWITDSMLLFTGNIGGEFGYYWYDLNSKSISEALLSSDGHPVRFSNDSVITDTYPDKFGIRRLLNYSYQSCGVLGSSAVLGEFVEPWYLWGQTRCDLHPSLSPSEKYLQIDVVMRGRRTVYVHCNYPLKLGQ